MKIACVREDLWKNLERKCVTKSCPCDENVTKCNENVTKCKEMRDEMS